MPAPSPVPLVAIVLGIGIAFNATSAIADTSGHALAQRFADGAAEEAERRKEAAEAKRQAAEEAEMLARARAEAAERKAAADKARAEEEAREAQRIAEEQRAEKARLAEAQRQEREKFIAQQIQAEEERQRAEAARIAEEKRVVAEKRAAEEKKQRLAEEQRIAREKILAEQKRIEDDRKRAADARLAEERRLAEQERRTEQRRLELAAEHEAAHARREERMRQIEQERAERERMAVRSPEPEFARSKTPMSLGASPPRDTTAEVMPSAAETGVAPMGSLRSATPPERVTVLLVMEPGKTGIRRFGAKTADPVLCSGRTCWIAAGEDRAAREVSRARALGPANTMGLRAAACNKHLACVFRDIDLAGPSASIQPIDLRVLRHDRREPLRLEADRSCRLASGKLVCDKLFATRSWRAWVIDEAVARKAGSAALEAALRTGLRPGPSAALASKPF